MFTHSPALGPERHTAPLGVVSTIRRVTVAGIAGVAALITMIAAMVGASATASSDTGSGNKLAGLEKSLVLLQTKWSGYISLPAAVTTDHQEAWTNEVTRPTQPAPVGSPARPDKS